MNIRITVVVLTLLFLYACKKEVLCPPDTLSFLKSLPVSNKSIQKPMSADLEVSYMKSLFIVDGRGNALFVPPDTLSIEVMAEWGEVLFRLKGAGSFIEFEAPMMNIKGKINDLPDLALLGSSLWGQPMIPPDWGVRLKGIICSNGQIVIQDSLLAVTYDASTKEILSVASKEGKWQMSIDERAPLDRGGLPVRLSIKSENSGNIRIAIKGRKERSELSGAQLLK
ncbi:MAG: hypothetical protein JNL74_18795 [Fibrobacteres bacterium]|nr:hypothetical protein [Fibrobacterota bacterium]